METVTSKEKNTKDERLDVVSLLGVELSDIERNEITQRLEKNKQPLSEASINSIYINLIKEYKIPKDLFFTYSQSDHIRSYNPLKDFLKKHHPLKPTGVIDALTRTIKPYNEANKMFITKWLVGAIASIYGDNYNVLMLIFTGIKNSGKTEWFRRLLPEELKQYFVQSKFDQGKDSEALMCVSWIILNDELDGMHSKEQRTFRNFISQKSYTYRAPYGRTNETKKRLASICGTCNDTSIIPDPEHNRRMIPINVASIDHNAYNKIDKVALLMEAYNLFINGYDWNLNQNEITILEELCRPYEVASIEEELLGKYFTPADFNDGKLLTATEVFEEISIQSSLLKNKGTLTRLGKAFTRLGFKKKSVRNGAGTKQVYAVFHKDGNQNSNN